MDTTAPRYPARPNDPSGGGRPQASGRLSRTVQADLGRRLRHFYDSLKPFEEAVPERFLKIIDRFEQPAPRENEE